MRGGQGLLFQTQNIKICSEILILHINTHILHSTHSERSNILKFKITEKDLPARTLKCSNCTKIQITKTTPHILPHPHAHTPTQTQNTQSPPHTSTHPPCHASWWKSTPVEVKHHPLHNLWASEQGPTRHTLVRAQVCAWACASLLRSTQWPLIEKTKNNIVRMQQIAVPEKGLGFV